MEGESVRRVEQRVVSMCDRLWEKLALVEDQVATVAAQALLQGNDKEPPTVASFHGLLADLAGRVEPAVASQAERLSALQKVQAESHDRFSVGLTELQGQLSELLQLFEDRRVAVDTCHAALEARSKEYGAELVSQLEHATESRYEVLARQLRCELVSLSQTQEGLAAEVGRQALAASEEMKRCSGEHSGLVHRVEQCETELRRLDRSRSEAVEEREVASEQQRALRTSVLRTQERLEEQQAAHEALQTSVKNLQQGSAAQQETLHRVALDLVMVRQAAEEEAGRHRLATEGLAGQLKLDVARLGAEAERLDAAISVSQARLEERAVHVTADVRSLREQALSRVDQRVVAVEAEIQKWREALVFLESRFHEQVQKCATAEQLQSVGARVTESAERIAAVAIQQHAVQADARAESMERQLSTANTRLDVLDQQRADGAKWRADIEASLDSHHAVLRERSSVQDHLERHDESIKYLSRACDAFPELLEVSVAEARTSARDDLAAHALAAFQGEVKLWTKLAQMGGHGLGPPPSLAPDLGVRTGRSGGGLLTTKEFVSGLTVTVCVRVVNMVDVSNLTRYG